MCHEHHIIPVPEYLLNIKALLKKDNLFPCMMEGVLIRLMDLRDPQNLKIGISPNEAYWLIKDYCDQRMEKIHVKR